MRDVTEMFSRASLISDPGWVSVSSQYNSVFILKPGPDQRSEIGDALENYSVASLIRAGFQYSSVFILKPGPDQRSEMLWKTFPWHL